MEQLLAIQNLEVSYGAVQALKGITLELNLGDIVAVLGANGAGKSTIIKAIAGLVKLHSGEIQFDGKRIDGLSVDTIVGRGVVCVPEGRRLFPYMSVADNIKIGAYLEKDKKAIRSKLEEVFELFPRCKERLGQRAGSLSGGEGSIMGTMIGVFIMSFLRNGCTMMGWPNYIQEIIIGIIIVVAVALDQVRHRRDV